MIILMLINSVTIDIWFIHMFIGHLVIFVLYKIFPSFGYVFFRYWFPVNAGLIYINIYHCPLVHRPTPHANMKSDTYVSIGAWHPDMLANMQQ